LPGNTNFAVSINLVRRPGLDERTGIPSGRKANKEVITLAPYLGILRANIFWDRCLEVELPVH
jgi:hypothetical protein